MAPARKKNGFIAVYDRFTNFDLISLFNRPPPPGVPRTIYIQQDLPIDFYNVKKNGKKTIKKEHVYSTNQVVTSKYTIFTFIPRNLLEQFRRVANIFFLAIAILQFFPKFSTISPGLVILPLLAVLAITAAKDGYEDVKRHQSDHRVNHTKTHVLAGDNFVNPNIMGAKSKTFTPGVPKVLRRRNRASPEGDAQVHDAEAKESAGEGDIDLEHAMHVTLPPAVPSSPLDRSTSHDPGQVNDEDDDVDPTVPHWESTIWEDVKVGDFVLLRSDDPVPADIVICATSEPEHIAFIETKNLDGETNLKSRHAVTSLSHLDDSKRIVESTQSGTRTFTIDAEAPDVNMYKLNAAVIWDNGERSPIDIQTVLLRGTVLRNTEWVIGVVLYTGGDTKIVMNSGQTPSKRSKVERQMNPMVFINLVMLGAMAIVCAIVDSVLEHRGVKQDQYWLYNDNRSDDNPSINGLVTFANALITFQNVIPISLYVSIEFVRTAQAAFIYFDSEIYYVKPGRPTDSGQATLARSWNLSDDLGQIEYIFSDKTGTLTQNSMEFRQCSIGGKVYKGQGAIDLKKHSEDSSPPTGSRSLSSESSSFKQGAKRTGFIPPVTDDGVPMPTVQLSEGVLTHFSDPQLIADIRNADGNGTEQSRLLSDFFSTLALCHTVLASVDSEGAISYKAQSPDEAALVQAAADVGYVFLGREPSSNVLRMQTPHSREPERYELLNVLDFTSTRKRMSVIVRKLGDAAKGEENSSLLLLCKGADQVIFERLASGRGDAFKEKTGADLDFFASEGLRTLCLAYKTLSDAEYSSWDLRYKDAVVQLEDRDAHIEAVSNEIEGGLQLLGATAIEDKLQEGVPETIADLKRAGIKIWVATGDKLETAIAIGSSTNLISREANLIVVRGGNTDSSKSVYAQMVAAAESFFPDSGVLDDPDVYPDSGASGESLDRVPSRRQRLNHVDTGLSDLVGHNNGDRPGGFVLVIDGLALNKAFDEPHSEALLLQLATRCEAVICCRVSPLQKALIVKLVKDGLGVMTLAIGDGANDVSMIQAADVGVGISGEEGLQAVNSSDYAIAQFRYLKRLLLVHGEWSYARNSNMIVNFFYKNILGIGVLWWFQIYCGWSTTYVFEYTYLLFWNVFWSLAPVIAIGIFDRNIDASILMALPELYNYGRRAEWFGSGIFLVYMLDGAYQSAVIFFLLIYSYMTTTSRTDGYDVYMYEFSTTMVISSVMVVNAFHGICSAAWTGWIFFAVFIGVVLIWIYTAVYSALPPSSFYVPVYGNDHYLFQSAYYWFGILLTFCIAMLPRYLWRAVCLIYRPNDIDIMRIVHKRDPYRDLERDPLIGGRFTSDGVLKPLPAYVTNEDRSGHPSHPMQRLGSHANDSTTSVPVPLVRTRTDMSTGLQLTPSRGFDFSTEEGGVAIRRIQTGLSERRGEGVVGPLDKRASKRRRASRLIPQSLRRSLHRNASQPPLSSSHHE